MGGDLTYLSAVFSLSSLDNILSMVCRLYTDESYLSTAAEPAAATVSFAAGSRDMFLPLKRSLSENRLLSGEQVFICSVRSSLQQYNL